MIVYKCYRRRRVSLRKVCFFYLFYSENVAFIETRIIIMETINEREFKLQKNRLEISEKRAKLKETEKLIRERLQQFNKTKKHNGFSK